MILILYCTYHTFLSQLIFLKMYTNHYFHILYLLCSGSCLYAIIYVTMAMLPKACLGAMYMYIS